jgi:hypothetical protein
MEGIPGHRKRAGVFREERSEDNMKQTTVNISVPSAQDVMSRKLPEKKFRAGAIAATIWTNHKEVDGKQTEYQTVSFERSYRNKNNEWQTTNSLRIGDLPKAVLVLSKAYEYLALNNEAPEDESF